MTQKSRVVVFDLDDTLYKEHDYLLSAYREIADRIAPYKTLVVEYYDESAPEHEKCEMIEHAGNIAKYRFMKAEVTAAEIIADLSKTASIKDVSIEEAGIDDIIKAAYEGA